MFRAVRVLKEVEGLELKSGARIESPLDRLERFCVAEYAYYDDVPQGDPNSIEPVDVLATVGINSRLDTAEKVRTVHLGLSSSCKEILGRIPRDADLAVEGPAPVVELLRVAFQTKFVALSTATKVLHRKRPGLVPVLDTVVAAYYLERSNRPELVGKIYESNKPASLEAAPILLSSLQDDLIGSRSELEDLVKQLLTTGFEMTSLRALDILLWSEIEPRSYYRDTKPVSPKTTG